MYQTFYINLVYQPSNFFNIILKQSHYRFRMWWQMNFIDKGRGNFFIEFEGE
jgi:hypothetical protein